MRSRQIVALRIVTILTALAVFNSGCGVIEDIIRALGRYCETANWTVTRTDDVVGSGLCTTASCSLRQAIQTSNNCPGTQTIHIPAGTYVLTLFASDENRNHASDLDITDDVNIVGDGNPVIDGGRKDRVFEIREGAIVDMTGLTVQNGSLLDQPYTTPFYGGGILNRGILHLHHMIITSNQAGETGYGGGIMNTDLGSLTVDGSRISGNSAGYGGGIASPSRNTFLVTDTVISDNTAVQDGGGVYMYGAGSESIKRSSIARNNAYQRGGGLFFSSTGGPSVSSPGFLLENVNISTNSSSAGIAGAIYAERYSTLQLSNVTITGNWASLTTGGIMLDDHSTVHLKNSLIALNHGFNCYGLGGHSVAFLAFSSGHNIEDSNLCQLTDPTDLQFASGVGLLDPALSEEDGQLVNRLFPISQAVDRIAPSLCPAEDQRNIHRPAGVACDVGAYELEAVASSLEGTPIIFATATPTSAGPVAYALLLNRNSNCRLGPGTAYEAVDAYPEGQSLLVDGKSELAPLWWQVQLPTNPRKHCWISSASGKPNGNPDDLPVIHVEPPPAPPVGGPGAPAAPSKVAITNRVCTSKKYSVTIGWKDNADNETGYHIYRDGALVATLGANTTSYTDIPGGSGPYTYSVEAFNAAGVSVQVDVNEEGCLI